MKNWIQALFLLSAIALISGCVATDPNYDYSAFRSADPHSILIVPVVNHSLDVEASDYFLSAISQPVAERGYYVFPVNMVKRVMEDDGLADPDMVHSADPTRLAALFGADTVLYVSIERWDAKYAVFSTSVTVDFNYVLKDGHTGEKIWESDQEIVYTSDDGGGGLIGAIVMAAVTKTHHGLPAGPYRTKEYNLDQERF